EPIAQSGKLDDLRHAVLPLQAERPGRALGSAPAGAPDRDDLQQIPALAGRLLDSGDARRAAAPTGDGPRIPRIPRRVGPGAGTPAPSGVGVVPVPEGVGRSPAPEGMEAAGEG